MPIRLREVDRITELPAFQAIASSCLAAGGTRYTVHPGDLAWWVHHEDPRLAASTSYWLWEDRGFVALAEDETNIFTLPGEEIVPLIEWSQERLGGGATVGWVSDADTELRAYLQSNGYRLSWSMSSFERDLTALGVAGDDLPPGWELRPVRGEEEADNRREASHRAFRSTMTREAHLQRYLRFMRSPVYDRSHDLVAVAPDGRIASFLIWWADPSGIAQIEPFGTHPDFQRQGVGTSLIEYGVTRMREVGMRLVRVCTQETREAATRFYPAAGFTVTGSLGWWRPIEEA